MSRTWESPPWFVPYADNNYGELFYSLVRIYQPQKVVELGTKAGFTAYHIARGLKANGKGKLYCYDLWEKYEFNSVPQKVARKNLKDFGNIIRFKLRNCLGVDKLHKQADILIVDLGNEGGILEKIIPFWIDKTKLIIVEGGSRERDRVSWMKKYKKIPIRSWLEDFSHRRGDIQYFTIEPFPSFTIIKKS